MTRSPHTTRQAAGDPRRRFPIRDRIAHTLPPRARRSLRMAALGVGAIAISAAIGAPDGGPPSRLCAGGDVSLGTRILAPRPSPPRRRRQEPPVAEPSPDTLLAPLSPLIADADVVLFNNESAIGDAPARAKCRPRSTACYALRAPPRAAAALARFGAGRQLVANVANNHSHDAGRAGVPTTGDQLRAAGIAVTGDDTLATVVALPGGDTLAFLGFSLSTTPNINQVDRVRRIVAREAAKYPALIVTAHLGAEGVRAQHTRDITERHAGERRGNPVAFAHGAIDAGAAMFIGHGPHVLRAMEWYHGRLIVYSLGNLLTHGPFSMREPLNRGAIACVVLDHRGGVLAGELRSTVQLAAGIVRPDSTRRAVALVSRLSRQDRGASGVQFGPLGSIIVAEPIGRPSP